MTKPKENSRLLNQILAECAKGSANEFLPAIENVVGHIRRSRQPLKLLIFTCSTINSEYLFSPTPWRYVSLDPRGNNLTADVPRLNQVVAGLRQIDPKIELWVMIGNTDPYYLYRQQFRGFTDAQKKILWSKFAVRWSTYRKNLAAWIRQRAPTLNARVISWFQFEKNIARQSRRSFEAEFEAIYQDLSSNFSRELLAAEFQKLRRQFGPGKYFSALARPSDIVLRDWAARKFAEYCVQGLWIYENIPGALLIQNEKPSTLRSKMYQPLIKARYHANFPVVYFFGVDDSGYQ